jgi:hypothetical protein
MGLKVSEDIGKARGQMEDWRDFILTGCRLSTRIDGIRPRRNVRISGKEEEKEICDILRT